MITLNSGDTIVLEVDNRALYLSTMDCNISLESTVVRLDAIELEHLITILIEKLAELKRYNG